MTMGSCFDCGDECALPVFMSFALESVLKPEKCQYFCSGRAVPRRKPQERLLPFEDFKHRNRLSLDKRFFGVLKQTLLLLTKQRQKARH